MRWLTRSGVLAVCAAIAGCAPDSNSLSKQLEEPVALTASASGGAAPSVAVSAAGVEAVAWVSVPSAEQSGHLYVSVAGAPAQKLSDALGPVEARGEAPPKLAFTPDGALVVVYTVGKVVEGERFTRSALRLTSSRDSGRTWSAPVTVNDRAVFGSHSFDALHVAPDGTIFVAWLGKSDLAGDTQMSDMPDMPDMAGMHDMKSMQGMQGMKGMSHEASTTWITSSTDGGSTWTPRVRVDAGEACPCCRGSLASTPDGTLYMAWRHIYPGSIRDIVLARSTDRGQTWSDASRVHEDNWEFDACPHAGPAIAAESNGVVHVAWWTGKEGEAGVYYAQTRDGGETFSKPVPMGVAKYSTASHVQIALTSNGRVIVAWDDGTMQVPQIMVRESGDHGSTFGPVEALSASGVSASFPMLSVSQNSAALVWLQTAASDAGGSAGDTGSAGSAGLNPVAPTQVMMRRGEWK